MFGGAAVAIATGAAFAMVHVVALANIVMVYLLATVVVAARGARGPAAVSAILSVLCFDYFFVPPRFSFSVSDTQYLLTFCVMFIVAMTISHLTIRMREEADAAREQEQRSTWLLEKAKKAEIDAETERLRSALLSSVSHDFRTPLAAILGSASTLLEKQELRGSAPVRELLENIETEAERLSRLVQNLLETTRLESGTLQLKKELYPLEEVVGSALERLRKSLETRNVATEFPEDLPLIPMDAILIEQVFINLLENAIRHTPIDGRLVISAHAENGAVIISAVDSGAGLKEEDLERVFEKFYHDRSSPGAGLGLAICRAIVNAHGGHIWAEHQKDQGAIFRFSLPLVTPNGH